MHCVKYSKLCFFCILCSHIRTGTMGVPENLYSGTFYANIIKTVAMKNIFKKLLITWKICYIYLCEVHLMSLFLIGTLFLWVLWPSFNSGPVGDSPFQQNRAVINTYLSLSACVATSFLASSVLHKEYKFKMVSRY